MRAQPASYRVAWRRVQACCGVASLLLAAVLVAVSLPPAAAAERPVRIVALGDSLTAGYGLNAEEAFPVKLEAALRARGHAVEVANAGVSGDTTTGGLARLEWSIPEETEAVILELGANDALRGIDPEISRRALDEIMRRLTARGLPVLLCGMLAPPNLGPEYGQRFAAVYLDLARTYDAGLYPFFLDGVAGDARLNLPDGLHPTAAGVDRIVQGILPKAEELVAKARERRKG